MLFTLHN